MIFLKKHSIENWRTLCDTSHIARYQRLLEQATSYHTSLPPNEHPDDSITSIGMAVANLALAYLLTADQHHLDTAREWIRVAIDYPHWGKKRMPDHDLDAAWLLFGLGTAYSWIKHDLPPDERDRLRNKLLLQGRRLYDFAVENEGRWWSCAYWQNHNWICYGGLATVAYALEDEFPETKAWSDRAYDNFMTILTLMADDGSDYEGPVYWRYGFIWFLIYGDLLQQQTGIDLHDNDFLRNAFDFRLYLSGPNLIDTANLGDCHDRRSAHTPAVYYRLASLYHNGQAQWLTDHFYKTGEWARDGREGLVKPGTLPEAWLEFLWYDPTVTHQPLDDLSLTCVYPDMGLVSTRTSWQPEATFMVFKCGAPNGQKGWAYGHAINQQKGWDTIKASHAHPDENGFILIQGDHYLVVDEGYSKAKRSRHHSTILVDGRGQYVEDNYNAFRDLGSLRAGRLEDTFTQDGIAYMRGDATRAYDPELNLNEFVRQVVFIDGDLIILHDTLQSSKSHQYQWLLQTDVQPKTITAQQFIVNAGQTAMQVNVLNPQNAGWHIQSEEITANPTSAKPDWIIRRLQHALVVSSEATPSTQFLVALNLADMTIHQCATDQGQLLHAIKDNQSILVGFSDRHSGILYKDGVTTDARWFALREHGKEATLLIGDCTQLWHNNHLLLTSDLPVTASMHKSAQGVAWIVRTPSTIWISLHSSEAVNITLNQEQADVQFNPNLSLARLRIPEGTSTINFEI